jgi:hypothetical protein
MSSSRELAIVTVNHASRLVEAEAANVKLRGTSHAERAANTLGRNKARAQTW